MCAAGAGEMAAVTGSRLIPNTCIVAHSHLLTPAPGDPMLNITDSIHACGAQTYMEAKHSYTKNKIYNN